MGRRHEECSHGNKIPIFAVFSMRLSYSVSSYTETTEILNGAHSASALAVRRMINTLHFYLVGHTEKCLLNVCK